VFHQLFEGMALGTRISGTSYKKLTKYLGMGIWYPLTTPFGIALGIGIRYTYNENSQTAILIQAFLDSAAGGQKICILLFK
jgi:zinc transporter 1/2/3